MEHSPLVQQTRPDVLKPKVINLYESLFQDEYFEPTEGFWRELFLLKPDPSGLRAIVGQISAQDLLHHHEVSSQELFHRAIKHVRTSTPPTDEIALDTLTAYLEAVLSKRYSSPSSDIIAILAGLEDVDAVLTDFVAGLDEVIRDGRDVDVRQKAVRVANAAISGAYQTGLVSYFLNRDLFPSLIKFFHDLDSPARGIESFALLGLLCNYNKFEFANPYRLRLEDFVDEAAITNVIHCVGSGFSSCRDAYIAVQDDQAEGWDLLGFIGLGIFSSAPPKAPVLGEEEMKKAFAKLPSHEPVIALTTFEFAIANSLFCINFVTAKSFAKDVETPFSSFLSFSSYLFQNAYRSGRASLYSCVCLIILQICLEDQTTVKVLCSTDRKVSVRLCRQRAPFLPLVKGDRVSSAVILDLIVAGLSHNLRVKLDVEYYELLLIVLSRLLTSLSRTRVRLNYHWAELWRALLSLLRFLQTYPAEISALPNIHAPVDALLNILAFSVSSGESFLPNALSYDDLFYKIVEAASASEGKEDVFAILPKHFAIASRPTANSALTMMAKLNAHYKSMLEEQKGRKNNLAPGDVSKIIKQGYETLDIQAVDSWSSWDKFREVERKTLLKRAARFAVADVRGLLAKQV